MFFAHFNIAIFNISLILKYTRNGGGLTDRQAGSTQCFILHPIRHKLA